MQKNIVTNIELSSRIRAFTGACIGSGFALAIDRELYAMRPEASENTPITLAEAASIASTALHRVEKQSLLDKMAAIERLSEVPGILDDDTRRKIKNIAEDAQDEEE